MPVLPVWIGWIDGQRSGTVRGGVFEIQNFKILKTKFMDLNKQTWGWLDQSVARLDLALAFGLLDHPHGDSILHRSTGIEVFALDEHLAFQSVLLRQSLQANQRRPADAFQHIVDDLRHRQQWLMEVRALLVGAQLPRALARSSAFELRSLLGGTHRRISTEINRNNKQR